MKLILIGFLALLALSQGREVVRSYKGSKVYSLTLETDHQSRVLWDAKNKLALDFWTHPRKDGETDVLVPIEEQEHFKQLLRYLHIHYKVKVDDVQKLIDEEKIANEKARKMRLSSGINAIDWESFARYAEIEEFIQGLPNNSSSAVNITVTTYGESYEMRTLYAVKYSTSQDNNKSIIVDANIHAREWITSASATWIMNELATKPDQYAAVLDGIDFYFLPMLNPDGYEFCHTTDRMWRKTRSVNEGSTCRGCDPNRNFPFHFKGASTSDDPCSDIFTGPSPLSEPDSNLILR